MLLRSGPIAATALIFGPAPLIVGAIPTARGAARWISRAGSELVESEEHDEEQERRGSAQRGS
jgi:hypothetical protein